MALSVSGRLLELVFYPLDSDIVTFLFFSLASVAFSLVSLKIDEHPSIGSSWVIYAINGFLIRFQPPIWYFLLQVLFYLATRDEGIDHAAGGFLFGHLFYDVIESLGPIFRLNHL